MDIDLYAIDGQGKGSANGTQRVLYRFSAVAAMGDEEGPAIGWLRFQQ
jgi:hypothetical protein